jgi:YidC/Oxa1 family membrane protein insertase
MLVKALLHPINKKNQAIMQRQQKKMAKIQPEMKEIKARYPNDALKANREIQKLMKEHDVNPAQMFGGCLLIFLQLPIWIGLFTTFGISLDLRHAPFLYIQDLAQADRLFQLPVALPFLGAYFNILPVIYVILTVINQKMMPKSSDPQQQQQQKIMMFMMVAFGFIFYNFASGLMLYFLTSSGLGIIEQRIIRAELAAKEKS